VPPKGVADRDIGIECILVFGVNSRKADTVCYKTIEGSNAYTLLTIIMLYLKTLSGSEGQVPSGLPCSIMTTRLAGVYDTPVWSGAVLSNAGTDSSTGHWVPTSGEERELVLKELDAILSSYHFRGSKRYPAMLKYVVSAAIDGRSSDLKERTLGVEVFGRDPNYDTSADPVVRISAGEVRKRIAQYYHENGNSSSLQIELPLGSYAPEFIPRTPEAPGEQAFEIGGRLSQIHGNAPESRRRLWVVLLSLGALVLIGAVAGTYIYRKAAAGKTTVSDKLWGPLVKPTGPILIVVGTSHNSKLRVPETAETTFFDHMTGPYHHVSVATATALANLAGVLRQRGIAYEIKEDTETSLTDLHTRPLVLVGATNNAWTMRLMGPLRFRFLKGPMAQVQDTQNPENTEWGINFFKPYSSVTTDYAIVARYHDPTTEGPVMVIAGLGPFGTEAASAFVTSPQYLEQIVKQLPAGWENKNVEMVLKTGVIDGHAGPPVLISTVMW